MTEETPTHVSPRYLSVTETAKLVRAALKREFPGAKFSVRSDSYAGGASVRVNWTDGPTVKEVDRVIAPYKGADFDGMVDLKTNNTSWLMPDGTAAVAHSGGGGSTREDYYGSAPGPDAELVYFGADYIPTQRDISSEWKREILAAFSDLTGIDLDPDGGWSVWDTEVPLAVDWSSGKLYHMVETDTKRLSEVFHQFVGFRQGGNVDTGEVVTDDA